MNEFDGYAKAFVGIMKGLLAAIVVWGLCQQLADLNWPFLLDELLSTLGLRIDMERFTKFLGPVAIALLFLSPFIFASAMELLREWKKDRKFVTEKDGH